MCVHVHVCTCSTHTLVAKFFISTVNRQAAFQWSKGGTVKYKAKLQIASMS